MSAAPARRDVGPTLLDRLRADTRAAHDRVEDALDWRRRVETLAGYRALLARWWGFYSAVEPTLDEAFAGAGEGAFFAPRRKLPLLRQDLLSVGLRAPEIDALPVCPWRGPSSGIPGALGTLYVLEGATLGGQIVARHVRDLHGWSAKAPGAAFYGGGADGYPVGATWRATKARLLAGSNESTDGQIVAAASATFEQVHAWLCAE